MSTQPATGPEMQHVLQQFSTAAQRQHIPFGRAITLVERQLIVAALELNSFNTRATAKQLNLTQPTLRNRMKALGIEKVFHWKW
jgi:DNA-binding NtrC family response regulator